MRIAHLQQLLNQQKQKNMFALTQSSFIYHGVFEACVNIGVLLCDFACVFLCDFRIGFYHGH